MPRKNPGSTATVDGGGNVSMLSTAPSETPKQTSPKQQKGEAQEKPSKKKSDADVVSLDDLLLPRTLINRIARGVLPANTSIQRDAILALTKSATVFISHLAAEANEMTDRKTIQSADVLKALHEIEFAQVMNLGVMGKDGKRGGRIEREIELWENNIRGKRRGYRDKVKARDSAGGVAEAEADTTVDSLNIEEEEGDEHQNKRRKRDSEDATIEESRGHENTNGVSEGGRNGATGATNDDFTRNLWRKGGISATDPPTTPELNGISSSSDEGEDEEEDDQLDEDEDGDEHEETQDMDGSVDAEDSSRRKHETLAPDGRVEVVGSDDDDDSE